MWAGRHIIFYTVHNNALANYSNPSSHREFAICLTLSVCVEFDDATWEVDFMDNLGSDSVQEDV